MTKKIILLGLLVVAFSCEKDEITLDGKRGKAPDLTFTTLTKKYQSGVQFTTSEINDAIKGDKKGYTLKTLEITDDGGTGASVVGTAPNFSVKNMTKKGRINAKITLSHKTKEEAVIENALFVLADIGVFQVFRGKAPDLTFTTLTKKYRSGVQFSTSEINSAIKGDKKGYTLKTLEITDDGGTGASVVGTVPNFSVKNMTKKGQINAKITLSHKTKEKAVIENALFVLQETTPAPTPPSNLIVRLTGRNDLKLLDVVGADDDGIIAVGYEKRGGNQRGIVLKLNRNGMPVWSKNMKHSTTNGDHYFRAITPLKDGTGYMIAGHAMVTSENLIKGWMVKIDNSGNELFNKLVGGMSNSTHTAFYEVITNDAGQYVFNGYQSHLATSEIWYQTDADGNRIKTAFLFGATKDVSSQLSMIQNKNGDYINAGVIKAGDILIADTTVHDKDLNWLSAPSTKVYGDLNAQRSFKDIIQLADGSYIAVGRYKLNGSAKFKAWLVFIDKNYDQTSQKLYDDDAVFNRIVAADGGGFVLAGTKKDGGIDKTWMMHIDKDGNKTWEELFQLSDVAQECLGLVKHNGTYYGVGFVTESDGKVQGGCFVRKP